MQSFKSLTRFSTTDQGPLLSSLVNSRADGDAEIEGHCNGGDGQENRLENGRRLRRVSGQGKEKESEEQKHGLRSWSSQSVQGTILDTKSRSTARRAGAGVASQGVQGTIQTTHEVDKSIMSLSSWSKAGRTRSSKGWTVRGRGARKSSMYNFVSFAITFSRPF